MKIRGPACLLAAVLFLDTVSVTAQPASELTISYEWSNGTVAPQNYQVHRITIRSSGNSEVVLIRGTAGTGQRERRAGFAPDPLKLDALIA